MNPLVLLVAAALGSQPQPLVERRLVFDRLAGKTLEGVLFATPESTPPATGYALNLVEGTASHLLADQVGAAAFAPDGVVLAVRERDLVELKAGHVRVLLRDVLPEIALDRSGRFLAVVRPAQGGSAVDLFDRQEGRVVRRLVAGPGINNAPLFSPDGGALLFVSTRTGLSSLFRVEVDGRGERQLTNLGQRRVGPLFVPPMDRAGERRFDAGRLIFVAGTDRWSVDVQTGAARRVEGGAR